MSGLRIGSLCSGYGGLESGLQQVVGGEVAWHVENDPAPSKILAHHWPDVPNYGDIKAVDWGQVEPVEWLTAGYPCQPFSHAGKRKGTDDERHIWPYVAAAIRALRPRFVLLENVAGHLTMGFDVVLADLAALGFDATWGVVRASDAGAPHGRARLFVVATDTAGDQGRVGDRDSSPSRNAASSGRHEPTDADDGHQPARSARGSGGAPANPAGAERRRPQREHLVPTAGRAAEPRERGSSFAWGDYGAAIRRWERISGRAAPDPIDDENRLAARFVEWMQGIPDGWVTAHLDPSPARRVLGNGVVPAQCALAVRTLLPLSHLVVAA